LGLSQVWMAKGSGCGYIAAPKKQDYESASDSNCV